MEWHSFCNFSPRIGAKDAFPWSSWIFFLECGVVGLLMCSIVDRLASAQDGRFEGNETFFVVELIFVDAFICGTIGGCLSCDFFCVCTGTAL